MIAYILRRLLTTVPLLIGINLTILRTLCALRTLTALSLLRLRRRLWGGCATWRGRLRCDLRQRHTSDDCQYGRNRQCYLA